MSSGAGSPNKSPAKSTDGTKSSSVEEPRVRHNKSAQIVRSDDSGGIPSQGSAGAPPAGNQSPTEGAKAGAPYNYSAAPRSGNAPKSGASNIPISAPPGMTQIAGMPGLLPPGSTTNTSPANTGSSNIPGSNHSGSNPASAGAYSTSGHVPGPVSAPPGMSSLGKSAKEARSGNTPRSAAPDFTTKDGKSPRAGGAAGTGGQSSGKPDEQYHTKLTRLPSPRPDENGNLSATYICHMARKIRELETMYI